MTNLHVTPLPNDKQSYDLAWNRADISCDIHYCVNFLGRMRGTRRSFTLTWFLREGKSVG